MSKKEIKKYLSEIGRRGGCSTSESKMSAVRNNLKKARKAKIENAKRKMDRNSTADNA
jgi:hypothetical protein